MTCERKKGNVKSAFFSVPFYLCGNNDPKYLQKYLLQVKNGSHLNPEPFNGLEFYFVLEVVFLPLNPFYYYFFRVVLSLQFLVLKLRRRDKVFPYTSCLYTCIASPITNIPPQSGTFIKIDKSPLTQHNHLMSIV